MGPSPTRWNRLAIAVFAFAGLMTTSAGCVSSTRISASNEISTAMFAIRDARVGGAEVHAADELQRAEELLGAAQRSSGAEAERLADQAAAQAQLAAAVARRERARERLADARRVEKEAGALKERTTEAVTEGAR